MLVFLSASFTFVKNLTFTSLIPHLPKWPFSTSKFSKIQVPRDLPNLCSSGSARPNMNACAGNQRSWFLRAHNSIKSHFCFCFVTAMSHVLLNLSSIFAKSIKENKHTTAETFKLRIWTALPLMFLRLFRNQAYPLANSFRCVSQSLPLEVTVSVFTSLHLVRLSSSPPIPLSKFQ